MGARAPPPMQSLEFLGEDLQPDEGTYLGPVGLDRLSAAAGGPEWHAYGGDGAVFCGHKRCGTRGGGRGFRRGELMWGWRSRHAWLDQIADRTRTYAPQPVPPLEPEGAHIVRVERARIVVRWLAVVLVVVAAPFAQFSQGELAAPDPATVRLLVRDRGTGIPHDRRHRIFDRFYQAHRQEKLVGPVAGIGLGLYISRQIVELHGGHIAAEFPTDEGTRFAVALPSGPSEGTTATRSGVDSASAV